MRYLFVVLVLVQFAGCATIIRGTEQSLQIMSDPPGAKAMLATGQSCVTPCSLNLSRSTSTVISFEKEGCERELTSVFPTIAGAGIVLGGLIDYGTGAVYNLEPNPVVANLRCGAGVPQPTLSPVSVTTIAAPSAPPLSTGAQLRRAETEFRAGRMSLEEFRQIKKVLQPTP